MANTKIGLNYYAVDTDRYQDRRVKRLKKNFGCKGVAVYDYVLCEVYRVRGCFTEWDENTAFDVAEYFGLKENVVREIVEYCGTVGLFDKELLSRGIVTSAAIQRRYLEMCNRAKRLNPTIPKEYRIITEESQIITEESPIIPEESPQSKVKESIIVNENNNSLSLSLSQPSESKEFDKLLAQQREMIFSIFFFKNFIKPEAEVVNFITHYAANGWRRSGGIAIKTAEQLLACATQWKQKEGKQRFDQGLLVRYYNFYVEADRSWEEKRMNTLLHGLVSLKWADFSQSRIVITGTRELCELLMPHGQTVAAIMKAPIKIVEYKQY